MTHPNASAGAVIHWAQRYDWLLALLTLGREGRFRERLLIPAKLLPGERVLDIGCGTGELAFAAKRLVGATGAVVGIDAGYAMIERAKAKAARKGIDVAFDVALAQSLPFPDASFDAVLSTVMLHHLPRAAREEAVREAKRVLKPGGRFLAVDFVRSVKRGIVAYLHRHGRVDTRDLTDLVTGAGFTVVDSGATAFDLQFVLGTRA